MALIDQVTVKGRFIEVSVGAFAIDVYAVTNEAFAAFVDPPDT